MTISTCRGCGFEAPPGGIPLDRDLIASPECWEAHGEMLGFELGHEELVRRCHQLAVDAYGAQHADPQRGRRRLVYSLVGLHLALDRGWSGTDVRTLHQRMGPPDAGWPVLLRPASLGALTVGDVVAAGARAGSVEGHAAAVDAWGRSVWEAWAEDSPGIVALTDSLLATGWHG